MPDPGVRKMVRIWVTRRNWELVRRAVKLADRGGPDDDLSSWCQRVLVAAANAEIEREEANAAKE